LAVFVVIASSQVGYAKVYAKSYMQVNGLPEGSPQFVLMN